MRWLRNGMRGVGVAGLLLAVGLAAQNERHGRKYKAPPETSHLEILVIRDSNGKVVENAGVIFHPTKDGTDEGNLEVKSGVDGKAFIDIIPTGSVVQVQVIANGFSTYSGTVNLDEPSKQLTVRMVRPQRQVSTYETGTGETGQKIGVQEPAHRTIVNPAASKPIAPTDPVIKLSTMPADPKQTGDPTVPKDHNVTPATGTAQPPKQPNKASAPTRSTVDGTAGSSPATN